MTSTAADPLTKIPAVLATKGYRLTGARRAVVEALVACAAPISVADLHLRVRARGVNRVSVYRAVHLLEELGLLRTADTSRGIQRYELGEEFTGHHHHLICQSCGDVQDLDGCVLADRALRALERAVRRAQRFVVTDHDLKLFGICGRCSRR
jgi:Fur family transcriptional regulator, ferric uptake regulator